MGDQISSRQITSEMVEFHYASKTTAIYGNMRYTIIPGYANITCETTRGAVEIDYASKRASIGGRDLRAAHIGRVKAAGGWGQDRASKLERRCRA